MPVRNRGFAREWSQHARLLFVLFAVAAQFLAACDKASPSGPISDPDAELVLMEPTGGETFLVGDSLRVRWKIQGKGLEEINGINVELSPDSGGFWVPLMGGSIPVQPGVISGEFHWKIPPTLLHLGIEYDLTGDAQILLRVKQYQTGDKNKISVTGKTINIDSP